jgi:hypothetical protein
VRTDLVADGLDPLGGDEVDQRGAGAVVAEVLEAVHPTRLAEALEPALRRRVGALAAETPVDLREAKFGQPGEELEVGRRRDVEGAAVLRDHVTRVASSTATSSVYDTTVATSGAVSHSGWRSGPTDRSIGA